jgi:hypothetical protein
MMYTQRRPTNGYYYFLGFTYIYCSNEGSCYSICTGTGRSPVEYSRNLADEVEKASTVVTVAQLVLYSRVLLVLYSVEPTRSLLIRIHNWRINISR